MATKIFTEKPKTERPCKRIPLRIRFKVTGLDEHGFAFEEFAESLDVSTGGGCLIFNKDIKRGENLQIYGPKGESFLVNVRWFRHDTRKNARYLGFKLMDPVGRWVLGNGPGSIEESQAGTQLQ
jgi:hypothetical protein